MYKYFKQMFLLLCCFVSLIASAQNLISPITINLPACNATRDGWWYHFMKKGTDAFAFILDPASTETFFDGATTKTFFGQGNTAHCKCENGLGWNLVR